MRFLRYERFDWDGHCLLIHEIEKYDGMARRNFGLGDSTVGGSLSVAVLTNQAVVQISPD